MTASLKSTSEGQTLILTLSNPDFKNALGPEMYAAGIEALNAAETNPEIRSVIITGEGTTFCAGGNLQRLLGNRSQPKEVQSQSIDGLPLRAQPQAQASRWHWRATFALPLTTPCL